MATNSQSDQIPGADDDESLTVENFLSKRGKLLNKENCFLSKYMFRCLESPWSSTNPCGYVNLGTAENYLCEDILVKKFSEPDFYRFTSDMLHYYPFHGNFECRLALSKFIKRYFSPSCLLDPEKIILSLGTCSAFDILAHLTADPDDVYLCPAPYYTRIRGDMFERSLVEVVNVNLITTDADIPATERFALSVDKFEKCFENSTNEGKRVKGIILVNPCNPLGAVYSKHDVMPILDFAAKKSLYVIVDEIYALTVYDENVKFKSILSYWDEIPDQFRTIWLWGFSKDFCNPGLRSSVMYTENLAILSGATKLAAFQCVPLLLQPMIEKFVSDFDWLDKVYFPTNVSRVRHNFNIVSKWLQRMDLCFFSAKAGFFVFVDFRKYLIDSSFRYEQQLFDQFFDAGVYIVPGSRMYCSEFGWFRIIFTVSTQALEEGLRRIELVLKSMLKE